MNISIPKTNEASATSIAELEKLFGANLPKSYLLFIKEHDGARPAPNVFKVGNDNNAGVDEFISAHEVIRIRNLVDGFPSHALPVARASGGNFVYLDPSSGVVYFWDHEIEDADIKLADSFDEFLTKLQPFDVSQIKLKPGQVKSAWINPDFLKKFKK
jgi:hypothetical protein